MATDVKLDEVDGTFLVLEARVVRVEASDFMLDSNERRKGGGPFRRALVHDQNDGLTINFNGDYPGGVTVSGPVVVRGGISYEVDVPTGAVGQGAIEGETHTITVNLDELLSAHQSEIAKLTDRISALEARLNP